ncbi:hypothetical protein CIHG_01754 [Coccidioides immitis H538.4]|uniref:Uncharacterized protein n=1 Tax=Coccidioides immitis H538.4 TaxID=396776 RepID=A0A0J8RFI4_COCIT|nr:hypothetical protein CIHG_01754 [Coccidioides immitis H538.4]
MARPENVDLAFNGNLNLLNAWNFDKNDIFKFLDGVGNDPKAYFESEADFQDRSTRLGELSVPLKALRANIFDLCAPEGADFKGRGENMNPDQNTYRSLNTDKADKKNSKFLVKYHQHADTSYWNPHDLLGLFLWVIAVCCATANARRFYIPMTAVYGRWCRVLSPIAGSDISFPAALQCTWRKRDGGASEFFLGGSLAGWATKVTSGPPVGKKWPDKLRLARYERIGGVIRAPYSFDVSVLRTPTYLAGTRFGNCAETYPFLELFSDAARAKQCHGIALESKIAYDETLTEYQMYREQKAFVRGENNLPVAFKPPCPNCEALIGIFQGDVNNFSVEIGNITDPD